MFTTILTLLALSAPVQANQPVTFKPESIITFTETTQKKADADCARVVKAIRSSNRDAMCSVGVAEVAIAQ